MVLIRSRRALVTAFLGLLVGLLSTSPAAADTFIPTRFDDPEPADKCRPQNCSLREAIKAANNHNGRDKVRLAEGTYELEIPPTDSCTNADGQLCIVDNLTLRGHGPDETKIDANGIDRVLTVSDPSSIQGLTLKGGDAGANTFHDSRGGGI